MALTKLDQKMIIPGGNNEVLTTDGSGNVVWAAPAASGLANVVEDTTPQLGGNLDVNGNDITSAPALAVGAGGVLDIIAAAGGVTSGNGGAINVTGGAGTTAGAGGVVTITGGAASAGGYTGGDVALVGGTGTNNPGDITLTPGLFSTTPGNLEFRTPVGATFCPQFRFYDEDNSHYTAIRSADVMASNNVYILPSDTPADGDILTWNTGSTLSWEPISPGVFTYDGGTQHNLFSDIGGTGGNLGATAQYNTLVGYLTGPELTSPDYNTMVGYGNGNQAAAQTGASNTIIGSSSGQQMTSAFNNTVLGLQNAQALTDGSNNILIGRWGPIANNSWELFIGQSNSSNNPPIIGGTMPNDELEFNAGKVSQTSKSDPTKVSEIVYMLAAQTTDATPEEVFIDGDGGTERMTIPIETGWLFTIDIVARGTATYHMNVWRYEGVIDNSGGNTFFPDVSGIQETIFYEGDPGWDVALAADNANDALTITVTGDAVFTVRWGVKVTILQVTE